MANSNPPQAGQWFYIQSNLTDSSGRTYVANIEAANASPGAQIILWPLQSNSYNVLWKYENGYIVSPLTAPGIPFLVLDSSVSSANSVTLNTRNESSSQQWTFNDDGTISNQGGGFVLDIAGGVAQSWASLVVDPVGQPSASQKWSIVYPQLFVPKWSFIQSGLTEDQNNPFVATFQEETSSVVLSPQANSSNQLWQITPDGRILSAKPDMNYFGNPSMILGAQLGGGQNGNYINVAVPLAPQIDPTTQWIFNGQNMLINASSGLALNVEGGSADQNPPLITYAVQSGPPENEAWLISPVSTMTYVMAMPPVPFPVFTGDQQTAYTYICAQLGVPDLRSQYTKLDVKLGPFLGLILAMKPPPPPAGVPLAEWEADWNFVVAQLTKELTAGIDIQALFANYDDFHGYLFSNQQNLLSRLITDAGMEQGTDSPNVGVIILSVFENVFYTVLEAIPVVGKAVNAYAVLGNIMEAGVNIGLSAASSGEGIISPDPFQVAVSELETRLGMNFTSLLTAISNMETAVLTDWGKMQATYSAIISTGPDSLAWGTDLTADLVNAATPGYVISVMQMLLPAKYQIFVYLVNDDSAVPDVPQNAQWIQQVAANQWCKYWIATPGNWDEYPSDEALTDVFSSQSDGCGGVTPSDFFQGLNGWGFARSFPAYDDSSMGTDCNGLVITITNQTPNPLTVTAPPDTLQGTILGATSQTLQPYGSVSLVGQYDQALAVGIVISDPNLAGSSHVAAFTAHQHKCSTAAGDVWVDSQQTSLGYQFTTPICNPGSFAQGFPGAVQIGICLASINPPPSN